MKSNKIIIIVLLMVYIVGLTSCGKKVDDKKYAVPKESIKNYLNIQEQVLPLQNANDLYMEILENITEGNANYLATMKYLMLQPSSFIMNIDYGREIYEYRNVNTDNIVDEWGDVYLGYQADAYIGDVVLDKYIRDFEGAIYNTIFKM